MDEGLRRYKGVVSRLGVDPTSTIDVRTHTSATVISHQLTYVTFIQLKLIVIPGRGKS